MADDLFDAVRPELAHAYDTKLIKTGPLVFGIYVGWGAYEHMSIKTMWVDFERILNEAAEHLACDDSPLPEKDMVENALTEAIPGWRRLFGEGSGASSDRR